MKTKTNPRNLSRSVFVAAIFCSIILSSVASAQLMGTKNIPGDYATLAAAITDLNTQGVGAGGVTLNLLAANPETAPAGGYVIGDTGSLVLTTTSMSSPVIIQGNANTITASGAQTVGNLNDAIFKLIGADWVTITGFVMQENAANTVTTAGTNNMTEWGVALLYVTTTDGAQNNTISSNTITLNRTYQNTFGIYSNSTHSATAVTTSATATGAAGGNSGLKIYGNNISNVNQGITVVGPTAAVDNNDPLDIGGAALATGNTLTDYGTTGTFSGYANVSGTVNGILVRNTKNYNVSYNTVASSNGGTTVGTLRGIYVPAFSNAPTGTFVNTINRNSVSLRSGLAAGAMNSILVEATTNSASSTLTIDNNDFNTTTHTVVASGAITLIQNSSTALTQSISNNTFTNLSPNTTGSVTLINNNNTIATATGSKNVNNNSIVTGFNKTGAGGTVTLFTDSGSFDVAGVTSICNNNTFSNITLTGAAGLTGINHANGSGPGTGPSKTISGNTISGITAGTGAITGLAESGTNGTSNVFNNTVSGITNAGILTGMNLGTTGAGTVNVYQNNINSLTSNSTSAVTGIIIGGGAGSTKNFYRNKICNLENSNAAGATTGINVTGGSTTTTNLYNNLIGDLRTPAASAVNPLNGINLNTNTAISSVNVSYNTIYLNATSSGANFGSSGLNVLTNAVPTTATLNLRNNAIVNLSTPNGTGRTAAYRRSSAVLANYGSVSNNNDFYAGAPGANNLIFFDGTNSDQTLAAYKTRVATRDSASVTENPTFLSTTCGNANFLHIDTTVATQLESAGANVAGITDDFDGNIRQGNPGYVGSGTSPDIGGDEFNGIPMDITPAVITYTPLANTASMANRMLATTITDGSGVPTMGAGLPVLYYRKGMAGAFTAAQATSGGGSSYTFTIDYGMLGGVMIGDAIQYYVVAQDSAATPNVGANPSAGAGAFTTNPPAAGTPPTTPSSYTIVASASGTFNVGAAQSPPYNTLTAAVADLNSKGLTGPVTFVLTDADYSTGETFPIVINPNGDSSPTNTITIKPANAQTVAINGSSATGIIRINGADYVTIAGNNGGMMATDEGDLPTRDLTITNSNAAGVCVWITSFSSSDGANNSTVQDCILSGSPGVQPLAGVLSGSGVTLGSDAEFANNNILVQNNNIFRVQNSCDLRGTTFAADTGWVVTGNICGSTVAADKNNLRGIRVGNCQGFLISGNTVSGVASTAASTTKVAGIQTNLVINGGTITQNKIRDIMQLNAGQTVAAIGIDLAGGNNIVVTNNFVSNINHDMTGGFSNGPASGAVGIDITTGTGHQVYYNSVNLYGLMLGTPSTTVFSAAFAINAATNTGCNVRNNIFANNMTGGTPPNVRHVAVYLPSPATATMNLTENNNAYYYGTDVTTQGVGQQGNIVGTFLTTLAQLQAYSQTLGNATNDNASIAFNTAVPFIGADDLHITCGSAVDNAGVPIAGITTDIDGNMRSATTPDMGADETQAPTAVSAVSRKTHGGAGDFDIDLPSSGPIGIECRTGGAMNDYQIVVTFGSPVTLDSAALTAGTGSVAMATVSGNTITVNLTGVTNVQYITVGLNCVSDGVNSGNMAINMGVLVGDTNGNGSVNTGDTLQTRNRSGQTTDATNFRSDVNQDGFINSGDQIAVRSRSGTALP